MNERSQFELWLKRLATMWIAYHIFRNFITMLAIIWLRYILPHLP
jgi:hypothetical protein